MLPRRVTVQAIFEMVFDERCNATEKPSITEDGLMGRVPGPHPTGEVVSAVGRVP
jgi:hypothetical protein